MELTKIPATGGTERPHGTTKALPPEATARIKELDDRLQILRQLS